MVFVSVYFLAVALAASLLLVPLVRRLSFRLGVLDHPIGKKQHRVPMPLLGGSAIFWAVYLVVGLHLLLYLWLDNGSSWPAWLPAWTLPFRHIDPAGLTQLGIILGGGLAIHLVGLADDAFFFDIKWRLLSETAVAVVVTALGIRPELQGLPALLVWCIAVFWIVGVTNAFNLLDGLDGLAGGIGVICALLLAIFCFRTDQHMVGLLFLILGGATLGFLRHNWNPATIYMGSGGSLFLGYMFATVPLVVAFMQVGSGFGAVVMPVLILSVPLYDTLSVMTIRLWHHRSPFSPDHNHLFHRLRRLGFTVKQVVVMLYLLCFAVGLSAMLLLTARPWETVIIIIHVSVLYAVFTVIELTGVRLHDRQAPVSLQGEVIFPETRSAGPDRFDAVVRLLTQDRVELEVPEAALAAFADTMEAEALCRLIIQPGGAGQEAVSAVGQAQSLWRTDGKKGFAGLALRFKDEWEQQRVQGQIHNLLYPDRATTQAEKALRESGRERRTLTQ